MTVVDPDRWRRLQAILEEALTLPHDERERLLDHACADDPQLRAAIERVLRADAAPGGVLDTPSGVFLDGILRDIQEDPPTQDEAPSRLADGGERAWRGEFLPGTILARRYRIVSLLGRGGMGEVYRADDLRLGQAVALKFVARDLLGNPEYVRRLTEEVKLARRVSHPNVCRVYDVGDAEGRQFFSMEYVDGEDLTSLAKRIGLVPHAKALDIARQLCAGLEAAHRQGVLHRDLKPANVMLDGRGQARITDFGVAIARERLGGAETRAGTLAYMAPEQLEGRPSTVRSDLYALGLVLYELFTGTRPSHAGTQQDLQRYREGSPATAPSRAIDSLDPTIERTIRSCLERDPELRPVSASAVAAALPGGDPIRAALAAGITPSPDLVATSGADAALSSAMAATVLLSTIVLLAVLLLLSDRVSVLGWSPLNRSPDALEEHARETIERLGYDSKPVDRISDFHFLNPAYVSYVRREDDSPDRWRHLRDPGQIPTYFSYRQALEYLKPLDWAGRVESFDPPPAPGDIVMTTDLRGRLIYFQAMTSDADVPTELILPPDWSALFREAGLDLARFRTAAPTRNPAVAADVRAAWLGVLADFGNYPVRVEAAAHRGRPVFFELVVPWDPYWDPSLRPEPISPTRVPAAVHFLVIVLALSTVGVLVVRNWLNRRGDRHGAFRLAAFIFCVRFSIWTVGGHHVPSFWDEAQMLVGILGVSLLDAAVTWCYYIALEPHARRLFPHLLISWTRILRGHVRDRLVGRDVLYGTGLGTAAILCWAQLHVLIPHALALKAPPPPVLHGLHFAYSLWLAPPASHTMLGGRYVLGAVPAMALFAFGFGFSLFVVQLCLRLALRKQWAANMMFVALISVLGWPTDFSNLTAIGIACTAAGAVFMLWAFRFGLVSLLVVWFCLGVWMHFPVTMRIDAPFFEAGLVGVLLIVGLALYGALTAAPPRFRSAQA